MEEEEYQFKISQHPVPKMNFNYDDEDDQAAFNSSALQQELDERPTNQRRLGNSYMNK
jgi:hypothetical protein